MLRVKELSVSYKKKIAVKNINFEVQKGEIVGFIGADGAGKSSIIHSIAGILDFDGEIIYNDILYKNSKQAEKIKVEMGLMPQGIGLMLYDSLSVEEHLDFFANIRGIKKDKEYLTYTKQLLHMAGLSDHTHRLAGNLSGGMMQKLALVCTLMQSPKLLLLDEPTTGVDPLSRLELWDILREIVEKENIICLVSTAYMDEAQKMDRVILFDEGKMIAIGKSEDLINSVDEFTYEETNDFIENSINTTGYTYSLKPLKLNKKEPTLESLFFVNSLRQNHLFPTIEIKQKLINGDSVTDVMKAINLTKKYNSFIANDSVSMELKSGEIVGLLGANGAGKTTF
ncbi:MAG: ATP-binding cassette domain-containing protein, partial [Arcobacteraceae bacterium]|nr:ATP-binding cassette domain-containing protein [Arcobacteraceae bacterium]